MESKVCGICNTEKSIDTFYNKYRKRKQCNIQQSMKHYYDHRDKLSIQRKINYQKKCVTCKV